MRIGSLPERETGSDKVVVEAEHVTTSALLHDRKADGVRVRDRTRGQALYPPPRGMVLLGGGELDRYALAGIEQVQRAERRLNSDSIQGETMGLGDHQVRGEQQNATCQCLTKEAIRVGVVLIAPTAQRDPGPAIDEQPGGSGRARGTAPVTRQRMSR